jgi:hypothetical protein
VDVFLHIAKRKKNEDPAPSDYFEDGEMETIPMILETIVEVSAVRINLPDDLTRNENKILVKETLKEVKHIFFDYNQVGYQEFQGRASID